MIWLIIKRKKLKEVILSLALFIGFLIICAPIVKADPVKKDREVLYYARFNAKTSLQGGDMGKALRCNLLPMYKKLATGTVPGDKYEWSFENAPFYVDELVDSVAEKKMENFCYTYVNKVDFFVYNLNENPITLFDIFELGYTLETHEMKDSSGDTVYRCALTGVYVAKWCTPEGVLCSREKALGYHKKTQKQIDTVVSKTIACRKNGKPLTIEQQLKCLHDWLVLNVKYNRTAYEVYRKIGAMESLNRYGNSYNEYGALVERKAVCQGYAYAFKALADELSNRTGAKIECEIVITTEATYPGHAWNRVKMNGKWYHVDTTWDDSDDASLKETQTLFFLVSDKALLGDHPGKKGYYTFNAVKATDQRYEDREWLCYNVAKNCISGTAKSMKKYKIGNKKAVRPFDKTFKPGANIYRYTKKFTNIKVSKKLTLKKGINYTVKYRNNRKKGWATAIITLKGQYKGKITIKFKIVK